MSTLAIEPGFAIPRGTRGPTAPTPPFLPKPSPAVQEREMDEAIVRDQLHPTVLIIISSCFGVMMMAFWLTFRGSTEALFSVAISVVYLAMYLGTPWLVLSCQAAHEQQEGPETRWQDLGPGDGFGAFLRGRMDTATGTLTGWEVVAQACSIPFAVMLATLGICLVIAMG